MSRKFKFSDKEAIYFVSYSVINWIDVFIRNEYKEILLDSWRYCQQKKGLNIYAWCIMTSHVHMIVGTHKDELQNIMRDMKSYTSGQMKEAIVNNLSESRKEWMLSMMSKA